MVDLTVEGSTFQRDSIFDAYLFFVEFWTSKSLYSSVSGVSLTLLKNHKRRARTHLPKPKRNVDEVNLDDMRRSVNQEIIPSSVLQLIQLRYTQ